jgi:hypothetical protein
MILQQSCQSQVILFLSPCGKVFAAYVRLSLFLIIGSTDIKYLSVSELADKVREKIMIL